MKKLALSLIILGTSMALAADTFAQAAGPRGGQGRPGQAAPGGPGGRRMGGGMRRMQEVNKKVMDQLNLTADQKKKVDELQKKTQTKMEGLRKEFKPGGDNAGLRDKFMAINQEHRKALMAILNADQKKKYETLMKAEMEKFRQNRGQNGQGGPGQGGARRRNGAGGGAGRPNGGSNGGGL